jgi:hypothetical protein
MSTSFVPDCWLALTAETTGGAAWAGSARALTIDKRRSLVFIILMF